MPLLTPIPNRCPRRDAGHEPKQFTYTLAWWEKQKALIIESGKLNEGVDQVLQPPPPLEYLFMFRGTAGDDLGIYVCKHCGLVYGEQGHLIHGD